MKKVYIAIQSIPEGSYVVAKNDTVRLALPKDIEDHQDELDIENSQWIIWSIEHSAWWAVDHKGYTTLRERAGVYSYAEALDIVEGANKGRKNVPNEAMVRVNKQLF